jgi:hypothetical protein
VGGYLNNIADVDYSVVAGGYNNTISANGNYSAILGGQYNAVDNSATYSFIGAGYGNLLASNSDYSTIGGGYSHSITGDYSTITGGYDHNMNGDYSTIGGGSANTVTGTYSTVSGGGNNAVTGSAQYATIAGGRDNSVSSNYGIAMGYGNAVSGTSAIAIGRGNSVSGTGGIVIGDTSSAATRGLALGSQASAASNQLDAYFSAGFKFRGEGTAEGNHVATFYNPNLLGNGIKIRINNNVPSNANNFVTFTNSSDGTIGRIEGQYDAVEFPNSDQNNRELALYDYIISEAEGSKTAADRDLGIGIAKTVLGAVDVGIAWANAGTGYACGSNLFTLNCIGVGVSHTAEAIGKIATVAGMALDVVQYAMNYSDAINGVRDSKDLKADWKCDRITNKGITYESGSGDYAEWLPKADLSEKFLPSDIVAMKNGKITKNTSAADQMMVVSMNPVVLGNMPEKGLEKQFEKVAFMGQVPVRVMGKVSLGDFILPSGGNNGLGVAKKPNELTPYDYRKIVGVAWSESKSDQGINVINVAVGLNQGSTAGVLEAQNNKIVIMGKEIDDHQKAIDDINNALVTLLPSYKQLMKLQSNGVIADIFKGLDFDKPKVVSSRTLKQGLPFEGVMAEQVKDAPSAGMVIPLDDMEKGYQEAKKRLIEAGGDPEADPFFSRMERDPAYKEMMLVNINRMMNKNSVDALIKKSNK